MAGDHAVPRTALVTGGTAGIGRAVAVQLAAAGHRVLFTGRDPRRAAAVLDELRGRGPFAEHIFVAADLSLLQQTAELVESVTAATSTLDAVVCCAGVLATLPEYTSEDLERTFVLNYLSRHLLVRAVEPLLRASASGRVVLVANAGRYRDTLDLDDLQHRRHRTGLRVAGRTQFANDLLAVELAERWRHSEIQVTCVYPGVVRTDVFDNARGLGATVRAVGRTIGRLLGATPEHAARTPVFLAASPDAIGLGGRFYGPDVREIRVPRRASRPARRQGLWDASDALVRDHLPATVDHQDPM